MILGIDLGTSNSMAAVYREGKPVIIESRVGRKQIPSIVSVDENGNFFAGDVAKERQITYPNQTVSGFKRSMGTEKTFSIDGKELKAVELSAIILRNIKEDAEHFLGEKIEDVVISVPAFFSNPQRKAVLQAGELAGLKVRQLINEPTAAAMAYGIQDKETESEAEDTKVIMVMDLGGGTFDISIVEQTGNIMEVVSVCGDNHLGGEDFTRHLMTMFLEFYGMEELEKCEEIFLWKQAEQAKKMFASSEKASMHCNIKGKNYDYDVMEQEYEMACFDLIEKMRKLALKAVEESKYEMEEIGEILMVGGGMKLSIIQKMVAKLAGKQLEYKINPDEAVALGAALTGHLLEQNYEVKDLIMTDICPYNLGVITYSVIKYDMNSGFENLLPKNTIIPAKRTKRIWIVEKTEKMKNRILYQASENYNDEAIKLGELSYLMPDTLDDGSYITYTIICDINGIVEFEIYVEANHTTKSMILCNENCELTMEEARKRIQELDYLKSTPMEEENNKLLYAKAERMYSECIGRDREKIGSYLQEFEKAIYSWDEKKILIARENLESLLSDLEKTVF
ncbi:MAG: Hsp70 family protein [Lachnospiraceae bacterium]|nr:Hsp70 family protein [Lachnospiraceae bacterium]